MNIVQSLARRLYDWMGILLIVCLVLLTATGTWSPESTTAQETVATLTDHPQPPVIAVDAGHGGMDGGATMANGVPEAGINLLISQMVEQGLREAGFTVVMTRTDEHALGETKNQDMRARRDILRAEGVCAVVSIHLNKFRDIAVSGPRVFYMRGSAEGEKLATDIVSAVCVSIDHPARPANPGDYYIVRESVAPAVIVECGFLSNPADAELLQTKAHQLKLAAGIVAGVSAYFVRDTPPPPASAFIP